jgi:hypothetical protein
MLDINKDNISVDVQRDTGFLKGFGIEVPDLAVLGSETDPRVIGHETSDANPEGGLRGMETLLAKDWTVIPAQTFAAKDEFQALAGERREVGLPSFDGKVMPLFSKDRKQLIKAEVDKDVAVKLAKIAGADYILIAYSEWAVATGRFVPTSKALAKNVVSIYDASGKKVYEDRADAQGDRTLGAMGSVVVDQNSIGEWVNAYDKGIHALYGVPRN